MKIELMTVMGAPVKTQSVSEHANMLHTTFWKSLIQEGNLPDLKEEFELVHNIYCSPRDRDYLKENYLPIAEKWMPVNIIPLVSEARGDLFKAVIHQMNECIKNHSILLFASADMIFGKGLIKIARNLKEGEYYLCPTFRTSESNFNFINNFLDEKHSNKEFAKLFIETAPHNLLQLAKNGNHEYMKLKEIDGGWIFYHKEPSPVMCYPIPELLDVYNHTWGGTWEVHDHDFPFIYFKQGKLKWVSSNDEFIWGEFTEDNRYRELIDNSWHNEMAELFSKYPIWERTL